MTDDIDIEEHNLMENPQIRSIFPDITALKQEILDSYDTEDETLEVSKEYGSINPSFIVTKTEPLLNETGVFPNISNVQNSVNDPYFKTKFILGSKPNKDIQNDEKLKCKVSVSIRNIKEYLVRSNRFCNNCYILFSTKQSYKSHSSLDCRVVKQKTTHKNVTTKPIFEINKINAMVHINTKDGQNKTKELLNKCFHCNIPFSSQNSLIDHLYDVLDSKKSKSKSIEDKCIANLDNLYANSTNVSAKNIHCPETDLFYQCHICTYYFNQIKFFEMHQLRKHGLKIASNIISKVTFNARCKYCHVEYSNIKYYNLHMIKKHKDIVTKIVSNASTEVNDDIIGTSCFKEDSQHKFEIDHSLTQTINKTSKVSTISQKEIKNQTDILLDYENILIFKSVVFRCLECHLNFLSSEVAINHEEHNKMLINWKCPKCLNFFKRNDEKSHSEQHIHSNSITVYDLGKSDTGKVLIKCSNCTIHFHEKDFANHISLCGQIQLNSAYCNHCDILISENISNLHQKYHKSEKMLADDFIFIDYGKQCMITSNSFGEMMSKRKKTLNSNSQCSKRMKASLDYIVSDVKSTPLDIDNKPTELRINKSIKDSSSSWYDSDSPSTSLNEDDENVSDFSADDSHEDSSKSVSVVTRKFQRSVKEHNQVKFNSVQSSDSFSAKVISDLKHARRTKRNFTKNTRDRANKEPTVASKICGLNSKPVLIKKRRKKVKRTASKYREIRKTILEKTRSEAKDKKFNFTYISQLIVLHLTYCDFCECFITIHYHIDFHIKSLCTEIQKRVCKICGIVVTGKGSASHKAFHKLNPSLELNDFTFYDIKSYKIVKPPIPKYPKCDLCKIHFTSKVDVIGHICSEVNFKQCNLCQIKLSDIAYKLHMPFHDYREKETKPLDIDKCDFPTVTHFTDSLETKGPDVVDTIELNSESNFSILKLGCIVFSCNTCNICVSNYDDLVKHCHSHYDRGEIDRKCLDCIHCNLKFENYSYEQHKNSHSQGMSKEDFKVINIDVFYFGCSNDDWIKYVFKSLSQEEEAIILENAIYKVESRIKMEISQEGPLHLTMYRCEKCRCFVDNIFIYKHFQNCVGKYSINPCQYCGINLMSAVIRNEHEDNVHKITGITLKSYRIISFNRKEHKGLNDAIANKSNCYVLYKCRNCNGIVDNRTDHQCYLTELKKCVDCGLLIYEENYDQHVSKHRDLDSFKAANMKVILIGKRTNQIHDIKLECSFSGIVYDYTFYKCVKCEVCVRSVRPSSKHFCLSGAAKLKCPKCHLIFDEGKLKFHLKQHSTDLDFVKINMLIVDFDPKNPNKSLGSEANGEFITQTEITDNIFDKNKPTNKIEKTCTVYKCACGLHHLTKANYNNHTNKNNKCNSKAVRQKCFKCGLDFTPNALFKHLLIHHGDSNVEYILNVVEL